MKYEWRSSDELDEITREQIRLLMMNRQSFTKGAAFIMFLWAVICFIASPYMLFVSIIMLCMSIYFFYIAKHKTNEFKWVKGTLTDLRYGGRKTLFMSERPRFSFDFPDPYVDGKRMSWLKDPECLREIDWQERRSFIGSEVLIIRSLGFRSNYVYYEEMR